MLQHIHADEWKAIMDGAKAAMDRETAKKKWDVERSRMIAGGQK